MEETSEQRRKTQVSEDSTEETSEQDEETETSENSQEETSPQRRSTHEASTERAFEQHTKRKHDSRLKDLHRERARIILRRAAAAGKVSLSRLKKRFPLFLLGRRKHGRSPDSLTTNKHKGTKVNYSLLGIIRGRALRLAGTLLLAFAVGFAWGSSRNERLLTTDDVRHKLAEGDEGGERGVSSTERGVSSTELGFISTEQVGLSLLEEASSHPATYREIVDFYHSLLPPCPPASPEVLARSAGGRPHIGPRERTAAEATCKRALDWPYSDAHPAVVAAVTLENPFNISPRFPVESHEQAQRDP